MHKKEEIFFSTFEDCDGIRVFFMQLNASIDALSNKEFSIYYNESIIREGRPKDNLAAECSHD